MEKRTELDTSMFKYINANSAQAERERKRALEISDQQFNERCIRMMNSFYENSVQDSENTKNQEIYGETYVNKFNDLKKRIKNIVAAGIIFLGLASAYQAGRMSTEMEFFNDVLQEKMEQRLTKEEIAYYDVSHSNPITTAFENYSQIKDVEKELKQTGNYDFSGDNITATDKDYRYLYTEDDLFVVSNLTEDAIDKVTDEIVKESRGHSYYGR